MATFQFIYDDFNDNSFDTPNRWTFNVGATGVTETGGKLNTPSATSAHPNVVYSDRIHYYDLTKGRLAYQVTKSGTTNVDTYLYFGMLDWQFKLFTLFGRSNDANLQVSANDLGAGTFSQLETTVGVGPTLPANAWLGWSYNASTKTYFLSKSTDAVTWTDIAKYVVTTSGAFDYKRACFVMGTTCYGTVTNFSAAWDNASYFATDTQLKVKYRTSSAWADASVKFRTSTGWKRPITRVKIAGGFWGRPNP